MNHLHNWLKLYQSSNVPVQKRALRGLLQHFNELPTSLIMDAFEKLFVGTYSANLDMLTRELRNTIITHLKHSNNPLFVEPLLPYASHPDNNVRSVACDLLGALQDKRATLVLLQRLTDPIPFVRRSAGFALASIRDPQSADVIREQYMNSSNEDINVLIALETALRELGVPYTQHPWPMQR
jgi:HEAT repeat protein